MALCKDLAGNLWIGTEGEGVFRYNPTKKAAEQWAQFTTKDGLGDDYGYALACDDQNRIWVGHLNHGVSVFNGQKWQTYEVVGGLSRPDTLNGPLGERIFKIAVYPHSSSQTAMFYDGLSDKDFSMAGGVWMASSAGLAIYFPKEDSWAYLTRAEGLPSDQANAIAFDNAGTVYIGTQCDGIAIAKAGDHYQSWQQITAAHSTPHAVSMMPEDFAVPTVGKGSGIPTDLMNDILVAKDQTVYAATTLGLAWSTDHGDTWQFIRGADWIDKVKNRLGGPPQGWQPPTDADNGGGILAEDYCTALAEDADERLLVGHRAVAGDILEREGQQAIASAAGTAVIAGELRKTDTLPNEYITGFALTDAGRSAYLGGYGQGISAHALGKDTLVSVLAKVIAPAAAAKLPTGAAAASEAALQNMTAAATSAQSRVVGGSGPQVMYVGEDWMTRGDWVGRYGRQKAVLCAANSAYDDSLVAMASVPIKGRINPAFEKADEKRNWLEGKSSTDPNSLYDPILGLRRQSEWDDHGESYAETLEGPDLWLSVSLPQGLYRVSLYFYAFRAHSHAQSGELRDMVISVGGEPGNSEPFAPLARARPELQGGAVYNQFLLRGGSDYRFEIDRNFGYNTILSDIFVDCLGGNGAAVSKRPLPCTGDLVYGPHWLVEPAAQAPSASPDGIAGPGARNRMAIAIIPSVLLLRAPKKDQGSWRYFIVGCLGVLAVSVNPNCAILLMAALIYAILTHGGQWRLWIFGAGGILAGGLYPLWVFVFYYHTHDDYRLYHRDTVYGWSWNGMFSYVSPCKSPFQRQIHRRHSGLQQYWASGPYALASPCTVHKAR